jgi:hypothetical protein
MKDEEGGRAEEKLKAKSEKLNQAAGERRKRCLNRVIGGTR